MKTITIIAEAVSDYALTAALPAEGVASVTVSADSDPGEVDAGSYRSFRNQRGFSPAYRVDVVVDDSAVESVFDGIEFAYGAGLFSDAEAWVSMPTLALTA